MSTKGSSGWRVPLLLFAAALTLHVLVAVPLARSGAFGQFNVIFDCDPSRYIATFMGGYGGWNPKHPALALFVNPPIRILGGLLGKISSWSPTRWHFLLALLVSPLVSALQTALFYLVLRKLGVAITSALALVALSQLSTSHIVLGSVPESYALSALAITGLFWLPADAVNNGDVRGKRAWLPVGVLTAGLTITNLGVFALSVLSTTWPRSGNWRRPVQRVAALTGVVLVVTLALLAVAWRLHPPPGDVTALAQPTKGYVGSFASETVLEFPVITAFTLFGPRPIVIPNDYALKRNNTIPISFSYREWPLLKWSSMSRVLLLAGLLGMGLWGWRVAGAGWSGIPLFAISSIGFHFAIHAVFRGAELFLYSLHWQVPVMFLAAGGAFLSGRARSVWLGLTLAGAALAAWGSYDTVTFMLETLSQYSA